MKLLITGGSGFIGSNFIRYMLREHPDYNIVNLDKLTYAGSRDNLKDIENDVKYAFIRGDICDAKLVDKIVGDCDGIINFAAESHVDRSIVDPQAFVITDVVGTSTLLEAARKYKISRFLHISTDEVYGSIEQGSFRESDCLKPASPYSASKASADLLCMAHYATYKTPVLITRSSNNFGPYQYPEKLISLFTTNALEQKKLPLYGDGLNVRDWIYVEDNCAGIDMVFHKGIDGEIYNIGGGKEVTNIYIAQTILGILSMSEDMIEYVTDRPGHDRRYSLDSSKIKKLGWEPRSNFDKALEKTVQWYVDNEVWWKRRKSEQFEKTW